MSLGLYLAEIESKPDDRVLRLVFADWLDEQGDDRGELIRIEEEVYSLIDRPLTDPQMRRLVERSCQLRESLGLPCVDWVGVRHHADYIRRKFVLSMFGRKALEREYILRAVRRWIWRACGRDELGAKRNYLEWALAALDRGDLRTAALDLDGLLLARDEKGLQVGARWRSSIAEVREAIQTLIND